MGRARLRAAHALGDLAERLTATHTTLLSPFDPVVGDRPARSSSSTLTIASSAIPPAPKRKYGYYVLPILDRGALIGRLDAKAHRAGGALRGQGAVPRAGRDAELGRGGAHRRGALRCARWHETLEVILRRSAPAEARGRGEARATRLVGRGGRGRRCPRGKIFTWAASISSRPHQRSEMMPSIIRASSMSGSSGISGSVRRGGSTAPPAPPAPRRR